ncbi:MAG: copper resistance protein B [Gammaproteobacteria bacterium]|nr:copper resistance protein B [Gammaproteobacteria bacterium]
MLNLKYIRLAIALIAILPAAALAMAEDDPLLAMVKIDQLEWRDADEGDLYVWEGEAWAGYDLNKFWVKTHGERFEGETESVTGEFLYSRAIAPYWDLQVGWRRDFRPEPERDWAAIGFSGLAPYFFELDAFLYAGGEDGNLAASLQGEYEILFTQRLVLAPEVAINWQKDEDPEVGLGDGLTDMEAGLRLRYEIRREFAPYIGVNWEKKFGGTADLLEAAGEDTTETHLVVGVRAWF